MPFAARQSNFALGRHYAVFEKRPMSSDGACSIVPMNLCIIRDRPPAEKGHKQTFRTP